MSRFSIRHIRADKGPSSPSAAWRLLEPPPLEQRVAELEDSIKRLFQRACDEVGEHYARQMFGEYGRPMTTLQRERLKKFQLKTMLEMAIKLGWTNYKLARHLAEWNKTLPVDQQWGIRKPRRNRAPAYRPWEAIYKELGRLKVKPAKKRNR